MFKSFTKYMEDRKELNAETGLVGKVKEKLVADYDGPNEKKPPGDSGTNPYKTPSADEDPNKGKNKDGFATMGDKDLVYNPNTKGGTSKLTSLGTEISSPWAKNGTKTEHFLNKTKKMNGTEFVEFMLKNNTVSPTINESIHKLVLAGKENNKVIENFISDAQRNGLLHKILEVALVYNESYECLGKLFSGNKGEARSKILARALQQLEQVGPPQGLSSQDFNQKPEEDEDEGMEDEDEFGDEDEEDDEMNMDDMDDEPTEDDLENDDDMDHPEDGDFEDEDQLANNGDDMNPPPMMKKSGGHNLFKAMKSYMNR